MNVNKEGIKNILQKTLQTTSYLDISNYKNTEINMKQPPKTIKIRDREF